MTRANVLLISTLLFCSTIFSADSNLHTEDLSDLQVEVLYDDDAQGSDQELQPVAPPPQPTPQPQVTQEEIAQPQTAPEPMPSPDTEEPQSEPVDEQQNDTDLFAEPVSGSSAETEPHSDPAQWEKPSPKWELGAGIVTVDDQQWTRINLGVDVPIWRFGVFFDLEFFIDGEGKFTDKGWNFSDNWAEALSRKVRYIRFGQPKDPLYVKFGALSNVSLGYGFVVDRFTNMLRYPDERLPGLQFNLNDLSGIGITVETMVADFLDFRNDGGLVAGRFAVTPLKGSSTPIINGVSIAATYAYDRNMYAPARAWQPDAGAEELKVLSDSGLITDPWRNYLTSIGKDPEKQLADLAELRDAQKKTESFAIIGADLGIPIVSTNLLNIDLYAQSAFRQDGEGWGIGAPGVAVRVWRLWGNLEYRHVRGAFTPGHFGQYYLNERLTRNPAIQTKVDKIATDTLNGIFGRLGMNIADVLVIDGSYQHMVGRSDDKDRKFEARGIVGDMLLSRIPKVNKAEVYYQKSRIGSDFKYDQESGEQLNNRDPFFGNTPYTYMGYRAGMEITEGASLVFDYRYGFKLDSDKRLESDNHISVLTALTF